MKSAFLESTPDNIPIEWVIPLCFALGIIYWIQGSENRRKVRKDRLRK
jgi:hypothetical protein